MYHILHNPNHWDEPEMFKPERFINVHGKCVVDPQWIPFELGTRMCPGRNFAMDVMALLCNRLVMDYEITTHIDLPEPSFIQSLMVVVAKMLKLPIANIVQGQREEKELIGMALILPKDFNVTLKPVKVFERKRTTWFGLVNKLTRGS